jgi:ABC-2 type transport system ATP-binding protein
MSPNKFKGKVMNNQAIVIKSLSKNFGDIKALNNLSVNIPSGIIFGFLGPNGAGKTTTIRLLLGLMEPTSGTAEVLGFDSQTEAEKIRAMTGALLEHTGIYEQMTAEDNLEFYGRAFHMTTLERDKRIQELLSRMGLWDRRKERAGLWSRGMKQKLALARTLLHKPSLILLDEPTAGLDVQAAVAIRNDLEALVSEQEVTIFLTTHNMTDAEKLCDQVAIIKNGELLAEGKPDQLRANAEIAQVEIIGSGFQQTVLNSLHSHRTVTAVKAQNNHLIINMTDEKFIPELVTSMVSNGAQIEEIKRRKANLEEVFLEVIGE